MFLIVGRRLWYGLGLKVPGGLLFTLAVWMTPLAIFGIEKMLGWWPMEEPGTYRDYYHWIKGGWFGMEIGTILAGLAARVFADSLLFPLVLCLLGGLIMAAGIYYRRHYLTIEAALIRVIPPGCSASCRPSAPEMDFPPRCAVG